jgi:hypothetical protein
VVDRELSNYIIRSLTLARDEAQVRAELEKAGWNVGEISAAYLEARRLLDASAAVTPPVKRQPTGVPQVEMARITAGRVFLFIGVLVIISAAAFFLTINWADWTPVMRFLSLLTPMLLCAIVGIYLWGHREKPVAVFFLITAGLLLPFVLFALSTEVIRDYFFDTLHQTAAFPWGVALLASTVVFMLCRRIFGFPAWSLLAGTAAILGTGAIATMFVISPARDESVVNAYMWGVLLSSAVVAAIAIAREKAGIFSDARLLYLPPALALKVALLVLASTGAYTSWLLANNIPGHRFENEWLTASTSLFISGALSLAIAWGAGKLLERGLQYVWPYRVTFGAFATFLILIGGLVMATGNHDNWWYSLVWLALILGFIFTGQRMQVRSFLYVGTLFMVVFVFTIGFEYFEDQAGWPLVLFASGLISLALGFLAERMSRSWKKNIG